MKMKKYLSILLLSVVLTLCAQGATPKITQEIEFANYPMHFVGLIQGADCTNQYQLDLFSNNVYFLRISCLKDGAQSLNSDEIGRWYKDEKKRLVLKGTNKEERYFHLVDAKTIELMDLKGNRIISNLNYKLQDSRIATTLEPRVLMEGMYSYVADVPSFEECITGMKFPVSLEQDHLNLKRSYLQNKRDDVEVLKVQIDAVIALKNEGDTDEKKATIVVKKFLGISPNGACAPMEVDAALVNTYWKLTTLSNKPINKSDANNKNAYMILSKNSEIKGYSGCNNFGGFYELNIDKIALSKTKPMIMSRKFCQMSNEKEFLEALNKMSRFEIKGEYLELFDKFGNKLAKFESLYLY
jgi:copper homeostasis protein (lipoprotein)